MVRKIPVLLVDDSALCAATQAVFQESRYELRCYSEAEAARQALTSARFDIARNGDGLGHAVEVSPPLAQTAPLTE